ncbi:cyanamide hydratase [Cryphonectria parasitica EP155]|uniref:Cyanamide hydratase n=1 Tax=Cryphonectria parasitica (strain ATCC 38755 / EP155) TaxID=660469 RepID=A0A9P4Y587_CRYP1|nr:cyanamide hydratase [Cryphonectria parasitica EP155]KAF3767167.1 cyanamide hydratase [Cryphonectria parasitica EP155]
MSNSASHSPSAVHGWTAVPLSPKDLLAGEPYIYKPESLLVKDIHFPSDDHLVTKVQQYAKEKLPLPTYHHSMRVYYFATAILQQQFPGFAKSLSRSTLATTALLHDIGTTHDNLRATQLSFEYYGGMIALDLVGKELGAPQEQAEAVAEAIFRHQELGERGKITFLGQLLQLATIYDNMGGHADLVHPDTTADVNEAFPRLHWSQCFAATIREENGLKPWAHTTTLGEEEFPEGVLQNPLAKQFE